LAVEKGIKTARLPISEHVDLGSRKVLAINHGLFLFFVFFFGCEPDFLPFQCAVVEILVGFSETGNWKSTLTKVIPKRKGLKAKAEDGEEDEGEEEENETAEKGKPDEESEEEEEEEEEDRNHDTGTKEEEGEEDEDQQQAEEQVQVEGVE
jgi:tRNA (guanine9-N1)-methyltransferase